MEFLFNLLRRLDLSADLLGPLIFAIPWIIRTIRKVRSQQQGDAEAQKNASQPQPAGERVTEAQRAAARERKVAVANARRTAAAMLRRNGDSPTAPAETSRQRTVASGNPFQRLRRSLAAEALSPPTPTEAPASTERKSLSAPRADRLSAEPASASAIPNRSEMPSSASPDTWHLEAFQWPDANSPSQPSSDAHGPSTEGRKAAGIRLDRALIMDALVLQAALSPRGTKPRRL